MAINLDAIKAALKGAKAKEGGSSAESTMKLPYWKAEIGEHELRLMPYSDSTGLPFQEVKFYEKLSKYRLVAPSSFGLPDPVKDMFDEKRKTKEGWTIAKNLRPRERYFALVIDRAHEEKGVQIWEFSKDVRNDFFGIFIHKDNVDDDMTNVNTGYDFTVNITQKIDANGKPATFNGYAVKAIKPTARKKPSKLSSNKENIDKWTKQMINLEEVFKTQVKTPEELFEVLENYVVTLLSAEPAQSTTTTNSAKTQSATAKIDAVFGTEDDDTEEDSAQSTA